MLHHACQAEWEFEHDAEAEECKKLCRLHHPHYNSVMHGVHPQEQEPSNPAKRRHISSTSESIDSNTPLYPHQFEYDPPFTLFERNKIIQVENIISLTRHESELLRDKQRRKEVNWMILNGVIQRQKLQMLPLH
jgi:hypothetical protein